MAQVGRLSKKPFKIQKAVVARTEDNPSLMEAITGYQMASCDTKEVQDIPKGAEIYPTKMVLTTKRDIKTCEYAAAKARLVIGRS
jgi:hypothetical protein